MALTNELQEAIEGSATYKARTTLETYGPQAALLVLLYKLDTIGIRIVTQNVSTVMMSGLMPPCSIPCAIISLSREFIQFCPKRMADKGISIP